MKTITMWQSKREAQRIRREYILSRPADAPPITYLVKVDNGLKENVRATWAVLVTDEGF